MRIKRWAWLLWTLIFLGTASANLHALQESGGQLLPTQMKETRSDRHLDKKWKSWFFSDQLSDYVFGRGTNATVIQEDKNKDGKPDQWMFLQWIRKMTRWEIDADCDGRIDAISWWKGEPIRYKNRDYELGKYRWEVWDRDSDGKVDIEIFSVNEKVLRERQDTNADDLWDV